MYNDCLYSNLRHPSYSVQTPALRCLGNIVTGDDTQTQTVINSGALEALGHLLQSPKEGVRKEACWMISNVTAGSISQVGCVLTAGLIPGVVDILQTGEHYYY